MTSPVNPDRRLSRHLGECDLCSQHFSPAQIHPFRPATSLPAPNNKAHADAADKLLSVMRYEFGGHIEKAAAK
jgi:hypothetical protein